MDVLELGESLIENEAYDSDAFRSVNWKSVVGRER